MAKLTKAELEAMDQVANMPVPTKWQKELLFQSKKLYQQELQSKHFYSQQPIYPEHQYASQYVQNQYGGSPCTAVMEQPGMWLVEDTKRRLLFCTAEKGHPGNHRFTIDWPNPESPPPGPLYDPYNKPSVWQTQAWEAPGIFPASYPTQESFIKEQYAKVYAAEKLIPDDITVSFKLDKEQGKK